MNTLIDKDGFVAYGLFEEPVNHINYEDFRFETPMGLVFPNFLKKFFPNQFHFFGVIGPDIIIGLAVIDLKYVTNGFFYIYDRKSNEILESKKLSLPGENIFIEPFPDSIYSLFKSTDLFIEIRSNNVSATGKDISINLKMDLTAVNPLRLCTRAGYSGWVYTQKTTPIPISGEVKIKDKLINISSPDYLALMDWTTGYMKRETFWNWAATASTLSDGRTFGLNLSCGVNETSFTENAFWLDGQIHKVDMVDFDFNKGDIFSPWHIVSNDKKIDLMFYYDCHRKEMVNAFAVASKFTQLMGRFEGHIKTDKGEIINISGCPGWAEDHYAKW